jgi:hypothetical protein
VESSLPGRGGNKRRPSLGISGFFQVVEMRAALQNVPGIFSATAGEYIRMEMVIGKMRKVIRQQVSPGRN